MTREYHLASDYQRCIVHQSKILEGAEWRTYESICPRCKLTIVREHGIATCCKFCKLRQLQRGNSLEIWDNGE